MISERCLNQSCDVGPVVIPALSSLTHEDADQIAKAVQAGAPDWEVDRVDDYDGYLSVLVSLRNEPDGEPSYLVSRNVQQQIDLSEVQGDMLRELGPFDTLQQATDALIALLTSRSGQ